MKIKNNELSYNKYRGSVEFSNEDGLLVGKVLDIEALLLFSGESVPEITEAFRSTVDEYLKSCVERGIEPQKPYTGSFNVRIAGETHRRAAQVARGRGQSLNSLVARAIENEIVREDVEHVAKRSLSVYLEADVSSEWGRSSETIPHQSHMVRIPSLEVN